MDAQHLPVLVEETLDLLAPALRRPGALFVDATVGLGGHAEAILRRSPECLLVGIDRDPAALSRAAERLAEFGDRARLVAGGFDRLGELLGDLGIRRVAGVLADLGVSSLQLESAERGFSFRRGGPLDMRMGPGEVTAADIVNRRGEGELEQIIRDYGEDWQARRIAHAIVQARALRPLETTGELKELIGRVKGGRREGRIDPATRVFQALRIAVNDELARLEKLMEQAIELLASDGRLVVISYHSLEDRIVKNTLRDLARGETDPVTGRPRSESQLIEVLTKKPVRPSDAEVAWNPRSRSARLRAARRL